MALFDPTDPNAGSQSMMTQEQIAQQRKVAAALAKAAGKARPMTHPLQAFAQGMEGLVAGLEQRRADEAAAAMATRSANALSGDLSVPGAAAPAASSGSLPSMAGGPSVAKMLPEIKDGIAQTAAAVGVSPVDLATAISYETGGTFDPTKAGPTTKWGQHRGLIQFGEPQAKEHGVDWSNPVASQLGPNGAIASYLRTAGVKPGMGLMDIYSAINAGGVGRYGASDAANGGAPGTVADKVNNQMAGHRAKAQALFADLPAPGASPVGMETGQDGFAVPPAPQPAMSGDTFNAITAGLDSQPLAPAFQAEGVSQPWMGTALPQAAPTPAAVAQAAPPMPPPRPADLAMPQADLPAPGAVPAIGQMPPASPLANSADPTKDNAGVLSGLVASEEMRKGLPSGAGITSPFAGIVQALNGSGAQARPQAQPPAPAGATPAERVAAALPPQAVSATPPSPAVASVAAALPAQNSGGAAAALGVNPRVLAAATSPYVSEDVRKVANVILQKQMDDAKYARPDEAEARRLGIELKRKELAGDPLVDEGRRLENDVKRKQLAKPADAPTTRVIKQADGSEVAVQWDAKGQRWIPLVAPEGGNAVNGAGGNPYALPGKPTESQSKDAGFAGRMVESHNLLNSLESVGTDRKQAALGAIPWVGNSLSSADKQRFEQAKRNFVTAVLRKESGAAISAGEFETEEKKYFPQVGDSAAVIAQKRAARELAIEGVMAGAGAGYKVPESYKPTRGKSIDTSKPGSFRYNPATGKMEPA